MTFPSVQKSFDLAVFTPHRYDSTEITISVLNFHVPGSCLWVELKAIWGSIVQVPQKVNVYTNTFSLNAEFKFRIPSLNSEFQVSTYENVNVSIISFLVFLCIFKFIYCAKYMLYIQITLCKTVSLRKEV